jgi:hypothetical protein
MEFANPFFLFGLVAIAIPIIIHLFNFRRFKKVFFTNVRFIQELKQQTRQQSQLRHLLILLMRILAIAALVLAFAQPYIPVSESTAGRSATHAISIYVDNSFSMEAESPEGRLLDQALNKAREAAQAYSSADQFQLLTNDFEGRHQRFVSREDFVELLSEVELSPVTKDISEVHTRQLEMLSNQEQKSKTAFIISDFQKTTTDFSRIEADTSVNVYAVPALSIKPSNVFIDSVWFNEPVYRVDQLASIHVRIKNSSDEDVEKVPVRLNINGTQRAISSFDISAGGEIEIVLPYSSNTAGQQNGELVIADHPVTYDDTFYFAYDVLEEIPVLAINAGEESVYLKSLFSNDSLFLFRNAGANRLDYTTFNRHNLIILNGLNTISSGLSQELKRFTAGGGSIVVFPGDLADPASYREFFLNMEIPYNIEKDTIQTRISNINLQSVLYDDVFESIPENIDLPIVFEHYSFRQQTRSLMEVLLEMQNGDIFLGAGPSGKGTIYLFSSPLNPEWTNFPKHAIFVPTLYKIALLSSPATKLYYTTGSNETIIVRNTGGSGEKIFKLKRSGQDFEIIPEIRSTGSQLNVLTGGQIKEAGIYNLNNNGELVTSVAFNFDRKESDLELFSSEEISVAFADNGLTSFSLLRHSPNKSLTTTISDINSGKKLWKLFLLAALAFLLAEVVLLRFWKQ